MTTHEDFESTWSMAEGAEDMDTCEACGDMVPVSDLRGVTVPSAGRTGVGSPTVVDACGDCRP